MKASMFTTQRRLELMAEQVDVGVDRYFTVGGEEFEMIPLTPASMNAATQADGTRDNLAFVRAYVKRCARVQTEKERGEFDESVFDEWFDAHFDVITDARVMEYVVTVLTEALEVDPKERVRYGRSRQNGNGRLQTVSDS